MNEQKSTRETAPAAPGKTADAPYDIHSHGSVDAFLQTDGIRDGRHTVEHGHDVTTDLLVLDRKAKTTVITFNGAAVKGAPRPYFQATGLLASLEEKLGPINRVHVHDGLLAHRDPLRIGWYLGTPQVDLSAQLTSILERILRQLRRGPVIIFGSSAGAFAALTQGEALPDTIVVAANPQTILERYEPALYRKWLEIGGWIPEDSEFPAPEQLAARTDLRRNHGSYKPLRTYLLLNVNDKLHVGSHVIPWMENVAGSRKISVVLGTTWGPNHAPAPREILEPFLKRVIESAEQKKSVTRGGLLGRLLPDPSVDEVKSRFINRRSVLEIDSTEIDLRKEGVRFAIREPCPGKPITVSAGLRASGRPIFHTHLISMELERDGKEYGGPMAGTIWSVHPGIGHFEYLPLREGHSRFVKTYTPPPDVSIVGVRFRQWAKGTRAHVYLTDVNIMGPADTDSTSDVRPEKDGQSS